MARYNTTKKEAQRRGIERVLLGGSKKSSGSSSLKKYEKKLISALKPTKEEERAIKTQNNLLANQELESKRILDNRINPVASTFQSGQIERLADDTDEKIIPLKYQIAQIQSLREGKSAAAKAKLDLLTTRMTSEAKVAEKESEKKTKRSGTTTTSTGGETLKSYNARKAEDRARGFVTLPKGVFGPSAPKSIFDKKKKGGRSL